MAWSGSCCSARAPAAIIGGIRITTSPCSPRALGISGMGWAPGRKLRPPSSQDTGAVISAKPFLPAPIGNEPASCMSCARTAGICEARDRRCSAVLEGRFALGDKGGHALLLVLGGEGRVEQAALEPHPFGEGPLEGAVRRLLDHHPGRPRRGPR